MFVLFHNNWYISFRGVALSTPGIQFSQNFLEAVIALVHCSELGVYFERTNLLALVGNNQDLTV